MKTKSFKIKPVLPTSKLVLNRGGSVKKIMVILLFTALVSLLVAGSRMDEPSGSRYLNYDVSAGWSSYYGSTDWPTSQFPKFIEDVDHDGRADVVVFGKSGTYVSPSDAMKFVGNFLAIGNFGTDQHWRVGRNPRFVVDINGDGYKDLLGYGYAGVYGATWDNSVQTPTFKDFKLWSERFGARDRNGFYLNPAFIRTAADMNNDEKADLVVFADDGVYVALNNNGTFEAPTIWVNNFCTNQNWNNTDYVRELTDVNGDGYPDIVGYGRLNVLVSLNNQGRGFQPPTGWTTQFSNQDRGGFYKNPDFIRTTGDVDGDRRSDLVVFSDNGVYVALSTGSAFINPAARWTKYFGTDRSWDNSKCCRLLADVNGDSKMDIVGFGLDGTHFSMSQGIEFPPDKIWVTDFGYDQNWRTAEHPRFLRDVNGDGVLDLVGYGSSGVRVSASAPLYCCDRTYYYDRVRHRFIKNGYLSRIHLPSAYPNLVMPELGAECNINPYFNVYHPVGPNDDESLPWWVKQNWRETLGARFMLNTNFFDLGHGPYKEPCTFGLGLSISEGELLSPYRDFNGQPTYVLLIYTQQEVLNRGHYADIVDGRTVGDTWRGKVQFAFSGTLLIDGGTPAANLSPDPVRGRARNAVGLTPDGNTLIFITQNNGVDSGTDSDENATLPALADALLQMGAFTAINLDGSGSAQMWFCNNKIDFRTLPSDGQGTYRPVPIVFGMK
jgi:hypothetical protein